jgi:hypothetical protein
VALTRPLQRVAEPELPATCTVLISPNTGAKVQCSASAVQCSHRTPQVYLVGTAHFSKESCEDVALVIQAVQPDIVMVELCKSRTNILHLDEATILEEAQNLDMQKSIDIIQSHGTVQVLPCRVDGVDGWMEGDEVDGVDG